MFDATPSRRGVTPNPYLKNGQDALKLFVFTVGAGSTAYFGGRTISYIWGGVKNMGQQFLSTRFGSTVGKIVSYPFKRLWALICWTGRTIKSLAYWGFSCIRHPIESLKSTFNRIRSVISFMFSWTILIAYQKVSAFINHYIPSMRTPLLTLAIGAPIAFVASFIPHHHYSKPELVPVLIKSIAILAGSLLAAPYLSQKLTSFSVSKLEAGAWGAVQGTLFFGLAMTNTLKDPRDY